MVRTAWRTIIPGFLLLLATCSEGSAAYVGDRFFPSTLATTVPTPADFYNPPYFVKLPDTSTTPSVREFDIPTTYSRLITKDWAVFFTETFRIIENANTHLSLEKDAPVSRAVDRDGHILCRPILGGLPHQYARI